MSFHFLVRKNPGGQTGTHEQDSKMVQTLLAMTGAGTNAMVYQPGTAMRVPAGAKIRFQIHYTTMGKEISDRSSVGMIFAKQPPEFEMHTSAFVNPTLVLPPEPRTQSFRQPSSSTRMCISLL